MMKLGDIFRLMLGLLSTMTLGAMGLDLYLINVPSTEILNIHFLGGFMMFFAGVMFILTYWYPRYMSKEK